MAQTTGTGFATAGTPRAGLIDRQAFWLGLFALYAAMQGVLRVAYNTQMFGDDAELYLWARYLAWGYGVQPPLYVWIQWGVNRIFGETEAGLAAMRALCLFGVYAGGFALARRFGPVRLAGLAALGLFLVPEIAQTFLRTRTHNVLVTALAPLVCLAFLWMLEKRRPVDYALFGGLTALAVLAKATGAIFPAALVLAALADRTARAAVLTPRLGIAVAVAAVLFAGPGYWTLTNAELATTSLAKFEPGGGWVTGLGRMAWSFVAVFGFVGASVGIAAALTKRGTALPGETRLLWNAGIISLGLVALGIIATDSAELKERWLVPLLAPLVPLALLWVLNRRGRWRLLPSALGALVAVGVLADLPDYFAKSEPPPRGDLDRIATALRATGADAMYLDMNIASELARASPGLPVHQRIDRGPLPCEGTVLIAEPEGVDLASAAFVARFPACRVEPTGQLRIDADGADLITETFRLTPSGG
jgi:4-amino-4-deoxy-L-arabinose transferase-like glycosyltransferase